MGETGPDRRPVNKVIRVAVMLAIVGLLCVATVLWRGFAPWTVGLGMFIGMPLVLLAIVFYLSAVIRDLKDSGLL